MPIAHAAPSLLGVRRGSISQRTSGNIPFLKVSRNCGVRYFSIGKDRSVEVTEAFLGAEEGLTGALYSLASLRTHLRRLEPGDVLMVTRYGLRMIFSDKTA